MLLQKQNPSCCLLFKRWGRTDDEILSLCSLTQISSWLAHLSHSCLCFDCWAEESEISSQFPPHSLAIRLNLSQLWSEWFLFESFLSWLNVKICDTQFCYECVSSVSRCGCKSHIFMPYTRSHNNMESLQERLLFWNANFLNEEFNNHNVKLRMSKWRPN